MEQKRIDKGRAHVLEVGRGPLHHGMYLPPDSEHAAFPMESDADDNERLPDPDDATQPF